MTSHKGWRLFLSPLYMYKLRPSCQVSNTEIFTSISQVSLPESSYSERVLPLFCSLS
ncbi:hypothetical protein LOK49_LG12G00359 [Camellia lanceoleosa]|uniref:Uncharacterized protein n=1 Tax=Camellia lanceoleosa TaxID=1840588 RepID=A0ACC0FQU3_9ERIC|nr:hypothetical protein LOK49_LG12G00359 [Camellia lanceoleosa]